MQRLQRRPTLLSGYGKGQAHGDYIYPSGKANHRADDGFHVAFIVAWLLCLLFYFMEYAVRSAPSVMLPELTKAFGLETAGLSSLIGLYYYTYVVFAVIAGASVAQH